MGPQEMLREHQRVLRKSIREIDRERAALERQEKSLTIEIKKMARQGQMNATRIMAKDLVRTRANIQKFFRMKSQLQAVSLRIQTIRSTAARAMGAMNSSMNLPAMQRCMMEFEKQSEMMDMKEEMMEDTMDDMFEMDEDEDLETDEVINKVLDEIGIDLGSQLASAPQETTAVAEAPQKQAALVAEGGIDADLQARLNNLK